MNKPASKEPSMDEILSSIRQIIADDDAAVAPRISAPPANPSAGVATPAPRPVPVPRAIPPIGAVAPEPRQKAADEPLALTPAQMVRDEPANEPSPALRSSGAAGPASVSSSQLVEPEDVTFDEPESISTREPRPASHAADARPEPDTPRPSPGIAGAAPMPDATLSRDMAEQLLEPATNAAVKQTFSRLSGISTVSPGVTVEALIRDMLRPMLKEWLDENLPAVVERMVEKEIARISRGGD